MTSNIQCFENINSAWSLMILCHIPIYFGSSTIFDSQRDVTNANPLYQPDLTQWESISSSMPSELGPGFEPISNPYVCAQVCILVHVGSTTAEFVIPFGVGRGGGDNAQWNTFWVLAGTLGPTWHRLLAENPSILMLFNKSATSSPKYDVKHQGFWKYSFCIIP